MSKQPTARRRRRRTERRDAAVFDSDRQRCECGTHRPPSSDPQRSGRIVPRRGSQRAPQSHSESVDRPDRGRCLAGLGTALHLVGQADAAHRYQAVRAWLNLAVQHDPLDAESQRTLFRAGPRCASTFGREKSVGKQPRRVIKPSPERAGNSFLDLFRRMGGSRGMARPRARRNAAALRPPTGFDFIFCVEFACGPWKRTL